MGSTLYRTHHRLMRGQGRGGHVTVCELDVVVLEHFSGKGKGGHYDAEFVTEPELECSSEFGSVFLGKAGEVRVQLRVEGKKVPDQGEATGPRRQRWGDLITFGVNPYIPRENNDNKEGEEQAAREWIVSIANTLEES